MSKRIGIQLIDNNDVGTVLDLKIDTVMDGESKIISGFVIGDTLEQNKACILIASPGDYKREPSLGVGINDALLDTEKQFLEFRHKIRSNFKIDGLVVVELDFYKDSNLKIEAEYE